VARVISKTLLSGWAAILGLSACQSAPAQEPVPAVLVEVDEETVITIRTSVAAALNKATVELGAADLTTSSTLSVLPPRPTQYETRSLAKPILFDLMSDGEVCYLVQQGTNEMIVIEGVTCRPL